MSENISEALRLLSALCEQGELLRVRVEIAGLVASLTVEPKDAVAPPEPAKQPTGASARVDLSAWGGAPAVDLSACGGLSAGCPSHWRFFSPVEEAIVGVATDHWQATDELFKLSGASSMVSERDWSSLLRNLCRRNVLESKNGCGFRLCTAPGATAAAAPRPAEKPVTPPPGPARDSVVEGNILGVLEYAREKKHGALSLGELLGKISSDKSAVKVSLQHLVQAGEVVNVNGLYALPDQGSQRRP
jgi:hypothetical protein